MIDSSGVLSACVLGPCAYRDGLRLQEALVAARGEGRTGDWLLFPDHPPVLTLGRGGSRESLKVAPEALERSGIELFEVARGGDVTWHGPGQAVGYLVAGLERCDKDLHRFLRGLERAIAATLGGYGLEAGTVAGRTGVWVRGEKIASIGVAVRRWVSYHGFALNVCPDLGYFDMIHPCGLRDVRMTSLAALLADRAPSMAEVREAVSRAVADEFGYPGVRWAEAGEPWSVAGVTAEGRPAMTPAA